MDERRLISLAFPSYLIQEATALADFLLKREACFHEMVGQERVILSGESLVIPKRVYFGKYNPKSLTSREELMLYCLYLSHHNGYLREQYLQEVLQSKEDFVLPYVALLLGDYVYEILEVLAKNLPKEMKGRLKSFLAENPQLKRRIESLIVSYWDCYYKGTCPDLKHYIVYQLFKNIDKYVR